MSWIKDFRLRYGLTQSQLARFAGITRNYLGVIEGRAEIPAPLERLLTELEKEFERATSKTDVELSLVNTTKHQKHLSDLQKRIERKEVYLKRLEKELAQKKVRYKNLHILQQVSNRWLDLKKDEDPLIVQKTTSLLSEIDVEIITCGPEVLSKLRLTIGRTRSEVKVAKEEFENLSQFTTPKSLPPEI